MRRTALLIAITLLPHSALAGKTCSSDSDCPAGQECKEAQSGKMRCFDKDTADKPADPGYKKKEWVCDSGSCGWTSCCSIVLICYPCAKCCWVTK